MSSRRARFHWRPWASVPVPGTGHHVRENWSKSGPSTTIGIRLYHRTISDEWVTDTVNALYWLPHSLRYFRQLGRFQRRRHRDAEHRHWILALLFMIIGAAVVSAMALRHAISLQGVLLVVGCYLGMHWSLRRRGSARRYEG
jgi:hypothetical protein